MVLQLPIPLSTTVTAASGPSRPHAQTAQTPATANSAIGLNPANSSLGIIDNAASGLGHRNKNPNTSGGGQHNNQSPLSHNPVGASNNVPIGPNINPNQHHHNNNDQDMSKTPVFSNLASGMYNNPRQNNYGYNANNNPSGLAASSSSLMFQNRPTPSSPQAPLPYNNNNMQPYRQIQTMQPSMHTMMLNNNNMRNTRMSYGGIAQNQSGGVFNPPFGGQVGRGSISNNPIGVGNVSNNAGNFGGMGTNFNAQRGIIPNSTQFNNPLSKVTVGGTTTINSNQNKHLAMNRNNNSNINGNSNAGGSGWGMGGRGIFGNRAREINAKSRPPLQPMTSTSGSAGSRDLSPVPSSPGMVNQQQQNNLSHQRSMHRTNFDGNDGSVGTAGDDGSLILAGADAASITHDAQEEVALTTGLVTLSVHEALTFGEVELALHPDVFLSPHSLPANSAKTKGKSSEGSAGGKSNGMLGGKLCPGDLVEIRVWAARPEFNKRSILPSKSKAGSSSVMKSKASANSSLHSRNPSLFSVSSASMSLLSPGMGSVRGSSLYGTPIPSGSASNKHRSVSSHIPPLPSIIGGDGPSPMDGSVGGYSSTGSLYGERLLESSDEVGASTDGSRSGVLYGEDLLDTPVAKETPGTMSHISSAASTLLAGGASLLFRNLNQPSSTPSNPSVTNATMPTVPSLAIDQTMSSIASPELGTLPGVAGDASTISHSRDSSLVTNSTVGAMHSRDSSILTSTAWMNALNTSSSQDNMHQTSPLANNKLDASISTTDTVRSNRPGSTESHVLPMRRDGPLMATSTAATMNLPPPHPLALHSTVHGVSTLESGTSTPTPSSLPSSPRITPNSTPPTSIPKPPVPLQHSTSSPIGDSNNQPSVETIKFDLTVTGNDRRLRSSTSDAPVAPSPSHTRNHSIGITGLTGLSSVTNTVDVGGGGVHRRHSSSIQTSYSSGPLLPPSLAKVSETKDDVDQSSTTNDSGSREINKNNTIEDAMELMQRTHFVRVSFVMPVSKGSLTSIKSGARTQVSLLKKVAELYNISAYDTVSVTQIVKSKQSDALRSTAADFVTVTMKDQFISRGDMFNFQKAFVNTWVYEGKRLTFNNIRTNAKVIRHGDHAIRSGIISEDTKMTFRSRSARIIWLVQMSSEMWDFASPYEAASNQKDHEASCHIYFDKFIAFVRRLFNKWKKLELTHKLTVVFFSRTYIRHQGPDRDDCFHPVSNQRPSSAVQVDADGRLFEDNYKIVIENETRSDWESLVYRMKQEFVKYPKEVGWDLTLGNERIPSTASQGNILEAINITLNLLHLHYIDRDLHRTGNSIVIMTAGNGVFEIEKNLAGITKQRMMDNGIGSDMLSLGLPPLHVAPFFLYKQKSSSSAEEIQGFDDWKTYFEVPHWMNLSFVRYDSIEEPMLYKNQHLNDEYKQEPNGNEEVTQTWHTSSGFLNRNTTSISPSKIELVPANGTKSQYKHLISDRKFEDILQACRPRSRGEYGSGLPTSLSSLLRKNAHDSVTNNAQATNLDPLHIATRKEIYGHSLDELGRLSHHQTVHSSRAHYLEWGAVNFDDLVMKRLHNPQQATPHHFRSNSGSQHASPSSSVSSIGSYMMISQTFSLSHLQSSTSLDRTGNSVSSCGDTHAAINKAHWSDDSMTTNGTEGQLDKKDRNSLQKGKSRDSSEEKSRNLASIEQFMLEHDKHTFSRSPKAKNLDSNSVHNVMKSSLENGIMNSLSGSYRPASPARLEERVIPPSSSAIFPFNKGGLEAALAQYDVTKPAKERDLGALSSMSRVPGITENVVILPEEPTGRSLAVSPLSVGVCMPFSLDRRNDALRPGFVRLVAPDGVPRATPSSVLRLSNMTDGSQMLDRVRHDAQQNKSLGTITSKESKLGGRRSSFNNFNQQTPIESGKISPMKTRHHLKSANKKHHHAQSRKHSHNHHHNTHRHRRKHWVLNPFRQEDEDEVLAKRTHNRRRWSHVFPLGEAEFKRHAGPNWKSLCQPAILPITIDFHPSPQELQDQDKFRIKQYSVTLPSMEETNYTSHTELLDELVLQRLIQDYQIVPQDIIQKSGRRGDVSEIVLEHILSMGHKIQRLSYNASSDSVDVIQYYANFAENENPQTYRYLLWSALRQDYVSVAQTFTKYTSPYKWNEVDMLISGDAKEGIVEGMRYPRISFVIIPDHYKNQKEEKEYCAKFQRLLEYFAKLQPKHKSSKIEVEIQMCGDISPWDGLEECGISVDKRFIVDLRKRSTDNYEWLEMVHDSTCVTRRTFRITMQWLVAVAGKVDQQAQLLQRRCNQFELKLVSVPHFSCLRSVTMNPFAVPIFIPVRNKMSVDKIESALVGDFNFVYDGNHMSDPNDIECVDDFNFVVNRWSIKKRKKFVAARQYLHRSGTLFARILRDVNGCAMIIVYLNQSHNAGDDQLLNVARTVFKKVDQYIDEQCKNAGC